MSVSLETDADAEKPEVSNQAEWFGDVRAVRSSFTLTTDQANNPASYNIQHTPSVPIGSYLDLGDFKVAELVGYEVMYHNVGPQGSGVGNVTSEGFARSDLHWTLLEQGESPFSNQVSHEETGLDTDDDGTDEADTSLTSVQAGDGGLHLYDGLAHYSPAFADSTNTVSGGPAWADGRAPNQLVNLRDLFGRGPVIDEDYLLNTGGFLQVQNLDDVNLQVKSHVQTFWDTFELADKPDYRDILG